MKLYRFAISTLMAVTALIGQSCSSADEVLPKEIQGYALLSRSDAQAQLDDLLDSNAFLDLDMSQHVPTRGPEYSEYEILSRAIWYRFYKKTRLENNRVVVDGNAADINISERSFAHCKRAVVDGTNEFIENLLSMGYSIEHALRNSYNITPESIERVRKLTPKR